MTVNDLNPFRADTVGKPLPGVEIKLVECNNEGIGQVAVRSRTVMAGYLDDPGLTAETIVKGWLLTGDLGFIESTGHLQLLGRLKNMIVTEGGKNIYPEDVETYFSGVAVKEYCVFAVNYVWKQQSLLNEQLMVVLHPEPGAGLSPAIIEDVQARNRRLADFKRISSYVIWEEDFPRTASLKIKRGVLADQIASHLPRDQALQIL